MFTSLLPGLAPDTRHATGFLAGFMEQPQKSHFWGTEQQSYHEGSCPALATTKLPYLVPVSRLAPSSSLCTELLNKLSGTQNRAHLSPLQVQTKLIGLVHRASPTTPAAPPYVINQ